MNDCMMLNYIRQNLDMGIDGINKVIPYAKNPSFRNALESQLSEYRSLYAEAGNLLCQNGGEEKNISPLTKMSTEIMSSMKCMSYNEDSKIAEDMIRGTTTSITKLSRHLGEYHDANPEIVELSKKVIRVEEKNVEKMKEFL